MNRIIISTSFEKLAMLDRAREKKGLPLLKQNPIIGFDKYQKCFVVDFNRCDVLLIQDSFESRTVN
ncbi:MAG: hypothetical protein IPJ26_13825 [Bacteroidetes bacterium]|nr:hypothetical protein [Bacteroidota bacterium]